jgi:hypothetical protein
MRFPPRLAHLATRSVVVSRLAPTYAEAHRIDDEEAAARLSRALQGPLLDDLLAACWEKLLGETKRLDEAGLLEKIARSLKDRPTRPGKVVPVTAPLSAFFVTADVAAGTASDAVRHVLETDAGRAKVAEGLAEAGALMARELTRK